MSNRPGSYNRKVIGAHSHFDNETVATAERIASGVPIHCNFCPGQSFRRSRVRSKDLKHLLLMRYPVRCLRCSQRQLVSFTLAAISVPSHVKQRKARKESQPKQWSEPVSTSLRPQPSPATPEPQPEPHIQPPEQHWPV
jgi:hypothetical protein